MTYDDLERLMFQRFTGWENSVIQTIGNEVKEVGRLTASQVQQLNNIIVAKKDYNAVMKELADITGQNIGDMVKYYSDELKTDHMTNKDLYDYRGVKWVESDPRIKAIVKANATTTAETMFNITSTTALGCMVGGRFEPLEKAMEKVLGMATLQVQTGATGVQDAVANAVRELGGSGVVVNYGSGVTRRLDTVVRQNVLWGAKQAHKEYNRMIGRELDCDGIEIDYHNTSRPEHEFMQGKQYAKGESVTVHGVFYLSADEVDPNSPDGLSANEALSDYGCRHFETDIILGVSEPAIGHDELAQLKAQDTTPIEVDGKTKTPYEWTQNMRGLENLYRRKAGEMAGLKAVGADTSKHEQMLANIRARYGKIERGTGIKGFPYKFDIF